MFSKRTPFLAGAASLLLASCADHGALPTESTVSPLGTSFDVTTAAFGPGPMTSGISSSVCAELGGGTSRAPAEGARAQVWACHGGANQQLVLQGDGSITAYDGARCLDVWGAVANDGDPVVAWTCHGGANQKWTRTAAGELRSAVNGKCLDLWGARGENGAKLVVWSCHGGANQKWTVNNAGVPSVVAAPVIADAGGSAELPRTYLDTSMPAATGRTISVAAGGNLQAALNSAQPGDQIVLAAGATFTGNFVLPAKAGMTSAQWITVRSGGALPAEGTRVGPADAPQMPKLLTPNVFGPALGTESGAQGWRIVGLELGAVSSVTWNYSLVSFGSAGTDQRTAAQVPSRLVLDRSYVHGSPSMDLRRCVTLNSASSAVIDSYLADCHSNDSESQGISGWNGPGPFKIVNNHLEGGHEVVMFGGNDASVPGVVPSDIEMRRNHVTRPLSWRGVWQVKNLLELKAGQRVLVEGNVFENNWADAQNGFAFVWWSLNAEGGAPWTVTQDVTFRYNRVKNVPQGFNLNVGNNPAQPLRRVTIAHNVVTGVDAANGRMFQVGGAVAGVTIANNSGVAGNADLYFTTPDQPLPTVVFQNNVGGSVYGVFADGGSIGNGALSRLGIPASAVTGNVLYSGNGSASVPSGNSYVSSVAAIGFANFGSGDLALASASQYLTAGISGSRPGADMATVLNKTDGVVR